MTTYDLQYVHPDLRLEAVKANILAEEQMAAPGRKITRAIAILSRSELEDLCLYLIHRKP